ncbi:DUF4153 domain-containing protein [Aliarcobacter butzleri]|uniref:DUF4153 domain-containing protein n=1 Tax=Aliarcobacter butzleri TaxID=28197 RepID=UPI00062E6063|nr:DUF4153 domain-containing protein [Aliarcobacter butzleri]KLD98988.1 beta-carotene 15,15-monooxygenase [Aliarcobacter butzleri L349]MCG3651258.1 DUF4153 domain-containing protein [Aliarcobacter butzleri]MCG3689411.1 DUF4153 domain-containing protein [Aliarcobacter butzleri]MCT7567131.1 DUF4153 domain-containing protein [Aliarcobacter butzleri]PZP16415.1 MAG: DUF4153 domain-containing protein [Aliarcobacter butzleri]
MIINSILNFLKKFLSSALEYKFPSFFAFLFSITSILLVSTTKDYIFLTNIAYASSLGFLLTLVSYFSKSKNILLIIALFLTALYFYSLPFSDDYSKIVLVTKHLSLIVISIILLLCIPFYKEKRDNQKFLNWAINIVQSAIVSLIFGIFLFLSLSLAITSIATLFGLEIFGLTIYLAIIVYGIFCTHYFLLSLDKNPQNFEPNLIFYNKMGTYFSKYILTTIAIVYSLILLGYIIKILLLQEWPNGIVVWLSLTFAIFSLITYIFWTPYKNRYKKLLIFVALIQLSLLFIAIYMRIAQYGLSTNRYMVVMAGICIVGAFLYILLYKKYKYEHIFLFFATFLFISQYGYKINSYYINDITQLNRLKELLSQNQELSNKTEKSIRCNISSSIESLYINRNIEFLNEAIPNIYDKYNKEKKNKKEEEKKPKYLELYFLNLATEELGFDYLPDWKCGKFIDMFQEEDKKIYINNHKVSSITDISGYDILYNQMVGTSYDEIKNPFVISYKNDKYTLKIPTKDKMDFSEFDMTEFINKFKTFPIPITDSNTIKPTDSDMTFIAEDKNMKIKLFFYSMKIGKTTGDISSLNTFILIKYLK